VTRCNRSKRRGHSREKRRQRQGGSGCSKVDEVALKGKGPRRVKEASPRGKRPRWERGPRTWKRRAC
jgi:hypothetical protein